MQEETRSKVFFADNRARKAKDNKSRKLGRLFERAGFKSILPKEAITAVKVHFGEKGNDTFVSPVLVRAIIDKIKACSAKPFLTDTNTLYSGSRHNGLDHSVTAIEHGFGYAVTGAPIIIADGLRGENVIEVDINLKHFSKAKIAGAIVEAESMLLISHFKGHEMAGFGGAIKNLAMGCATGEGKRDQHSPRFEVRPQSCVGCAECLRVCPENAVSFAEKKASIDKAKCIGCGECLTVCQAKAIFMDWATELTGFTERMVEYAFAATAGKENRLGYINFLTNITPDCDCASWSDAPIVPDIGILASLDPVALDTACRDLVNMQAGNYHTHLKENFEPGEDKFKGVWNYTMGDKQIAYAEEIGLGSSKYELVRI